MTNRYHYLDPIFSVNTRFPSLKVVNGTALLRIFRTMSGTADILDSYTTRKYRLRKNYLFFPQQDNTAMNGRSLVENFPEEVKMKDLEDYFRTARTNVSFYESIEVELLKCTVAEREGRYLESFFYIYRVIEGISYSIPLIYVSKNKDYNKSYGDLQAFFGKDKDGELAFFKRFVTQSFSSEAFFQSNIKIDLLEIEVEELRSKYYELYISKIKAGSIVNSEEGQYITVTFLGLYDLIIELRNRFFHNAKGSWHANFESTQLLYPDIFFRPIIDHCINWVCLIIFEVIKVDLDRTK